MGGWNRRDVLISGAAMLAGSAFFDLPGKVQTKASPSGPFLVTSDDGRNGSPWIIRGVTPIRAKISGKDVLGRFSMIEVNTPQGRGPELHVHVDQNEVFYLLSGQIGLQCGSEKLS